MGGGPLAVLSVKHAHDLVFAVGSVIFTLALSRAILAHAYRVPRTSSIPTATVLSAYVVNYATMGLWLSMATTGVTASLWWIIAKRGPRG